MQAHASHTFAGIHHVQIHHIHTLPPPWFQGFDQPTLEAIDAAYPPDMLPRMSAGLEGALAALVAAFPSKGAIRVDALQVRLCTRLGRVCGNNGRPCYVAWRLSPAAARQLPLLGGGGDVWG